MLCHICWGPGGPLPFSRPQTLPPPGPGIGWKVGGSRRMARCYAPPVVGTMSEAFSQVLKILAGHSNATTRGGGGIGSGSFKSNCKKIAGKLQGICGEIAVP